MSRLPSPCGKFPLFIFLFLFLTLVPFPVISQSPSSADREVLLDLKRRWGNPPWLGSWNSTSSQCDWPEIRCTAGAVTGVSFRLMNITEIIPPTICNLKNLTVLDLSFNYFTGNFPKFLYNCSNLEYLDVSENYFVGPIPSDIDRMSTLTYLDLNQKQLLRCHSPGHRPVAEVEDIESPRKRVQWHNSGRNRKSIESRNPSNSLQRVFSCDNAAGVREVEQVEILVNVDGDFDRKNTGKFSESV